jgi:CheY-like chemotaxis protein
MAKLKAGKPDLLILDVMMAGWSDGFEMARELRKNPEYKEMPIIMLTGVEQRTGIGFKSTAGDPEWLPVDAFLDKPVEPQVLLAEVRKLLSDKP